MTEDPRCCKRLPAIGCAIVMLMKSPACVADPYPPPGRDPRA